MKHEPLARAYRPRTLMGERGIRGQEHVARGLLRWIDAAFTQGDTRQPALAPLLFAGPRGTGKTTLARLVAMALNCPHRSRDEGPCGECDRCERIHSGQGTMDVIELDAAANRGVDDARELRETVGFAAAEAGAVRVYVLDECHMLTAEAWSALLKTLEEPPPGMLFVGCTTDPETIEKTSGPAMSRFQRFDLRRLTVTEIQEQLALVARDAGFTLDEDAALLLARLADGGMRDGLQALEQVIPLHEDGRVTAEMVRLTQGVPDEQYVLAALDILSRDAGTRNRVRVQKLVEALERTGGAYDLFHRDLMEGLHDLYLAILEQPLTGAWTDGGEAKIAEMATRMEPPELDRVIREVRGAGRDVGGQRGGRALFAALQAALSTKRAS